MKVDTERGGAGAWGWCKGVVFSIRVGSLKNKTTKSKRTKLSPSFRKGPVEGVRSSVGRFWTSSREHRGPV